MKSTIWNPFSPLYMSTKPLTKYDIDPLQTPTKDFSTTKHKWKKLLGPPFRTHEVDPSTIHRNSNTNLALNWTLPRDNQKDLSARKQKFWRSCIGVPRGCQVRQRPRDLPADLTWTLLNLKALIQSITWHSNRPHKTAPLSLSTKSTTPGPPFRHLWKAQL